MAARIALSRMLPKQSLRQIIRQQRPHTRFNSSQSTPPPPPPPPKSGSYTLPIVGVLALAAAGGYYYYKNSGYADGITPANAFPVAPGKKSAEEITKPGDYQAVYNAIAEALEDGADEYDDGSFGPVIVRLAWHASGTYDKDTGTGGSNGATMRFAPESDHGANAGLKVARDHLETVKAKFPWITYSDLWTLAGVCGIQEMGGPIIPWRPGRIDRDVTACTPDGRLPDAAKGARHIRDIFYRMGFNDQEIVALSGAHALGRCHTDRSGYKGPWTFSPTVLTNEYYKLLLSEKWVWKKQDESSEGKMIKWIGPAQYEDAKTKTLMMLPTDYSLVQDKAFKKWVVTYADDNEKFFEDFSKVVAKLFELGVPFKGTNVKIARLILDDVKPITLKKTKYAAA